MSFVSSLNYKQKYTLFGVGFGVCFPLFAISIDGLWLKALPLTTSFLFEIHAQNPIHFVIDSAPLVLGFAFGMAGSVAQNLYNLKKSLELRVTERTRELQASEEELRQNIEELQTTQTQMQATHEKLTALQQEEKDANEIFRALFEYSTDAHLLFDDTGIINCNNATVKLLGYETKDAILNLHPAKLSPTIQPDGRDSSEKAQEMDRLAQEKGFHRFEWIHQKADGTDFPVEVTLNPIKVKDKNTLLVVWHDLTEIKQKENALQQSNVELSDTLTNLQETQTQLVLSEKMASLGQLIASVAHEINTPLGAIRSSVENVISELAETMVYFPAFVLSLPHEELNLFLTVLEQTMNQKIPALSTREARKVRVQMISELEELQVAQGDELAELLVDSGVCNLTGFENVWKSQKAGDIVRMLYKMVSIRRSAENIQEATERASKIIFALKNFSRQDHSGEKVPADINDSLDTVLTLYQNQIKQGIEVGKNFADLPTVLCYPDELVQVWTNLIHNAIQAMGGKGVLSLATKLIGEKLQVSITDTGAGIPADIQSKIFNAFFTTKKLGEGSGLGLDIVKKIIDKHAGKIWFETEVGKGTTFFVEIPLA